MMTVRIEAGSTLSAATPEELFEGPHVVPQLRNLDVSPGSQRFLMIRQTEEAEGTSIGAVLNWFEELDRLVPTE
jgi:hypothetical protein